MTAKEVQAIAFKENFRWAQLRQSKEYELSYTPFIGDTVKVYFDGFALQEEELSESMKAGGFTSSWSYADAKLIKVELYRDGVKIREKS